VVAQYVKKRIGNNSKIIVHGISLGGAIASHIAAKGLCDFVVCDRTFGSLSEVPRALIGSWATIGLKFLFEWDTDNTQDYYYSNCYKIVATDPNDEIISDGSSMKTMLSKLIIQKEKSHLEL
jgi:hypothetical protein